MRRLLVAMSAFAGAASLNTASVALQQRSAFLTRRFGRRGWYIHLALVLPAWLGFLLSLHGLDPRTRWSLPAGVRPLGTPVLTMASVLWLTAYAQLGGTRSGNGNLFGHGSQALVTGGIFRFRQNPMYDSYVLALIGQALRRRNATYLLLAGEAAVLFYGIEARVENRGLRAVHATAVSSAGHQDSFDIAEHGEEDVR